MQLRHLSIRHFRGIESLDWAIATPIVCIVGAGDVGKSTILDAIEATLSTNRRQFFDTDFTDCDTTKPIEITATVGELSTEALSDGRMGLYLRGWSAAGDLHDEPLQGDEAVVSVRLTVDASLDPLWELVTDRQAPHSIRAGDRALLGVARLSADTDAHLAWGQYSMLARLSAGKTEATSVLAEAWRKARSLIAGQPLEPFKDAAEKVRAEAQKLGAYSPNEFAPGLDTQRSSTALAALSLHSEGVPVRMSGLGTRRLIGLAAQRIAIPEGAIVLIDEIEHGLEPHRIRRALKVLRDEVSQSHANPVGQVILTTHSAITVVELQARNLAIALREGRALKMKSPGESLQRIIRRMPEAFLARRLVVCEGKTEVGLLRGLRDVWAKNHADEPIEHRGTVFVDGNGTEAPVITHELAQLGYRVALLRDSDVVLKAEVVDQLKADGVAVFAWSDNCSTEERVFLDVTRERVQELLNHAYRAKSAQGVKDAVCSLLGVRLVLNDDFASWSIQGRSEHDVRRAVGTAAKKGDWYQPIEPAEEALGKVVAADIQANRRSDLAKILEAVEAWAYGG